ncbi:GTPase [Algoriphagus sp.]|uniref:GTPase n=1 Tax=Algoriphagus sp. TaxID=1872435 RepID=UPI0039195640
MESTEQKSLLEEFLIKSKKDYDAIKNAKVICGVIGQSGSGKSSLINSIFGEKMSQSGPTQTTLDKKGPFQKDGLIFYDLPGCGTNEFPKETYSEVMDLNSYDCLILVTSNRFYENDRFLIEEANRLEKSIFIVRSRIDEAISNGKYDYPEKEEKDIINLCFLEIESSIRDLRTNGIYLVSSRKPTDYDLPLLLEKIAESLDKIKRAKFISQIFGANEEIINEKRKIAKKVVKYYSSAAALNGINPIPGLDVALDVGLILKMNQEILKIFNLDEDSIAYLKLLKISHTTLNSVQKFGMQFLTKEAILLLLKKYAPQVATKQITKYIPFAGQAISATIAFGLTMTFGNKTIEECAEKALEILSQVDYTSFE